MNLFGRKIVDEEKSALAAILASGNTMHGALAKLADSMLATRTAIMWARMLVENAPRARTPDDSRAIKNMYVDFVRAFRELGRAGEKTKQAIEDMKAVRGP